MAGSRAAASVHDGNTASVQPVAGDLKVFYDGRLVTTRVVKLGYVGHRTIRVKLPLDARTSVRTHDRPSFRVTGTFSGAEGTRRWQPTTSSPGRTETPVRLSHPP